MKLALLLLVVIWIVDICKAAAQFQIHSKSSGQFLSVCKNGHISANAFKSSKYLLLGSDDNQLVVITY